MADKIIITLDLESGDVKDATGRLEKVAEKSGGKAGRNFSKAFDSNIARGFGNITAQAAKVTAAIGSIATAFLGFKSINAAQIQEDAIKRLNVALQSAGDFSLQASQDLQEYAAQLQSVTRFGDEAIINQLALAKSFGATNEQAKQIVETATGLSTAFGIDLESATRNVAKTLGGFAGELGETIPQLKELTQQQLQAGIGINLLSQRFAEQGKNLNTFSFLSDQAANTFGDLLEEIGNFITKNPLVIKALKDINDVFKSGIGQVSEFLKSFDTIESVIDPLFRVNEAIVTYVIAPFEQLFNILGVVQSAINTFVAATVDGFGQIGRGAAELIGFFDEDNALVKGLRDFAQTSTEVSRDNMAELKQSLASVFNFPVSESLSRKNEELRQYFVDANTIAAEQAGLTREIQGQQVATAEAQAMTIRDVYTSVFDGLTMGVDASIDTIEKANKAITSFSEKSGKQLQQGFGKAAGNAFAQFGAAVAQGNASLSSFTDALFKQLAQSAVTLGTNFILEGTAYLFSANPALQALGPGLIGSGAALAAFGGALGAVGGGGGSAAGGSAGGGGAVTTGQDLSPTEELAAPEAVAAEERVNLSLNVEGSLIRESELGGYVAELLEQSGSRDSTVIPSLRTA